MPSKNLASVWNNLKKIPELKKRNACNTQLNDGTVLPFLVALFKDIYKAYIQSDRNSWDYQISCYNFNGLATHEAKESLIKQYNNCLYFYSTDKTNPWVIDERDKRFIKIIRKCALENEEKLSIYINQILNSDLAKKSIPRAKLKKIRQYLYEVATLACFKCYYDNKILIFEDLKYQDAITKFKKLLKEDYRIVQLKIAKLKILQKKIANSDLPAVICSKIYQKNQVGTPTYWEKIESSLNRNTLFKFINTIWDAINSYTTLLRWISFILVIFSLPFPNFPLILFLTVSIIGYIIFCFTSFTELNKISTFPSLLEIAEKDKILSHIKQEVFNKAQYEKQFSIFQNQLLHLDIKIENLYINLSLQTRKNLDICIEFENSAIYQKLNQVSPKTQFITSLVTKAMSVTLSAYLISWAASIFFNFIGALTLASLISSPLVAGLFILIPACIFLIRHLIKYQSRKNIYQRNINNFLQESCEFNFIDNKDVPQTIKLKKWQKFEFLAKEIRSLELEIKQFRENNQLSPESQKLFLLFNDYLKDNDIYKSNYQDKRQRPIISSSVKIKKILSRLLSFSVGGFYGFSLGEQIAFESSLGFKNFFEIISPSPYILFFTPLIIIHGTANFLTYHLNSRQQNLLFFAEHLDSKLQILEYRRKILSYLTAILKELDSNIINTTDAEKDPSVSTEKQLAYRDLAVKKINLHEHRLNSKFFMSPTSSLTPLLPNQTDNRLNLTR